MKATYDSAGRMVAEKWYDSANTLTAHYKYVYDGQGNIVRSLDILSEIEYTYTYEGGRVARAAESSVALDGETVTSRELVNSILYSYDTDGKPTKKRVIPAGGKEQTTYYESPENENTVVKLKAGGRTVTSHSKTDSFGRKVFDELQLGTGFVSRQFHYHAGDVTDEHAANEKLKSSATTQLVSQIVLSGGRTISYEYDAEERITKVTDSVDGVTEYTYDELGQLLAETLNGEAVNTMVYDGYGNIVSKNGIAYTYGDPAWKDILTAYNGQPITYDKQGNPTTYLGHTLAWEKGRQLKSFDTNTYTYNANGIRTSKTVNGVKHTYTLDGTKILCEAWSGNTLVPLYDNEEGICGIIYNDEPFYFRKNLQGDIIGIVDKNAHTVARYSYDAWGACTVVADTSECSVAAVNPFRYRGYYFDVDTSLYYLQSRYYDPAVGRFVNADSADVVNSISAITDSILYSYCRNCPPNYVDSIGYFAIAIAAGVTVSLGTAAALIALSAFAFAYLFDRKFRNAVKQLITLLIRRTIDGIGYISNVISDAVSSAKRGRRYNGNEVHHIVARSDYRAEYTRTFIKRRGIEVSDPFNLVNIKNTLHRHLHTNAYHTAVAIVLCSCAAQGRSITDQKYAIIAGMVLIGVLLKAASRLV